MDAELSTGASGWALRRPDRGAPMSHQHLRLPLGGNRWLRSRAAIGGLDVRRPRTAIALREEEPRGGVVRSSGTSRPGSGAAIARGRGRWTARRGAARAVRPRCGQPHRAQRQAARRDRPRCARPRRCARRGADRCFADSLLLWTAAATRSTGWSRCSPARPRTSSSVATTTSPSPTPAARSRSSTRRSSRPCASGAVVMTTTPTPRATFALLSINGTRAGRRTLYLAATGETVVATAGFAVILPAMCSSSRSHRSRRPRATGRRVDQPPCRVSSASSAAAVMACTPVSSVGWMTGANVGLWFVGMSCATRSACSALR